MAYKLGSTMRLYPTAAALLIKKNFHFDESGNLAILSVELMILLL